MVGYDPANKDVQLPQYAFGVAGALSGFVTRAISQPLDVVKIRLQVCFRLVFWLVKWFFNYVVI